MFWLLSMVLGVEERRVDEAVLVVVCVVVAVVVGCGRLNPPAGGIVKLAGSIVRPCPPPRRLDGPGLGLVLLVVFSGE